MACSSGQNSSLMVFTSDGNELHGQIIFPESKPPFPAIVFVAGDGHIPRNAYGYYAPYISLFNNLGYAAFSWDKPGVGKSTGHWLKQSMAARQEEVRAAIASLRQDPRIDASNIGLIGFSQAGWVMPRVMGSDRELSFMIMVSPAINWRNQGDHMMEGRLRLEGFSTADLAAARVFDASVYALIDQQADYKTYLELMEEAPPCCNTVMSAKRWEFVSLNARSDARAALDTVTQPILALFGDKDLNINYQESVGVISALAYKRDDCKPRVVLVENADHSLLPATELRLTRADTGIVIQLIKIRFFGERVFAAGSLSEIRYWIEKTNFNGCW